MSPKITLVSVNSCEFPTPPLGIASIATYLVRKGVVDKKTVQILDLNLEKKILPKIKKFKPDIIGISSMTQFYPRAIKLAKKIKAQYPNIIIIILTAYDIPEYREAAYQYNANYFLTKGSASKENILTLVESILSDR